MNILILFAHPAFHKSRVNKELVEGISGIKGVTFHDLYEEYPELDIDAKREQQLLEKHDVIVFYFPLFWYSTPSILKEWQDIVLEHGWAFGSKGNELKDKFFLCVLTTGGPRATYRVGDFHNHTLTQLLSPIHQTALLCKMKPLPPFVLHGTHSIENHEISDFKKDYINVLNLIINEQIDLDKAGEYEYLNDYLTKEELQYGR